jgi:hypothetical protein
MRLLKKNPKWKTKGRKREKKFHGDQVVISSILLFTQWDFFLGEIENIYKIKRENLNRETRALAK